MKRIVLTVLFCLAFAGSIFLFALQPTLAQRNEPLAIAREQQIPPQTIAPVFSLPGGFYTGGVSVELTATSGNKALSFSDALASERLTDVEIYYTMDGSAPSKETAALYTGPIYIDASDSFSATVLTARAYWEELESADVSCSYFVNANITSRFDIPVVSIISDPEGLYGYEKGILVEGAIRDEFLKSEGIEPESASPFDAANYTQRGREWEKASSVEIFDPSGQLLVNQGAGVRVYGGWTRGNSAKSLRLIARKEYDASHSGKFHWPLFENNYALGEAAPLDSYDELVLRFGGNNWLNSFVNDTLISQLARDSGYPDTQHNQPVSVFLNGEYYGMAFMICRQTEKNLQEWYGTETDNYQIVDATFGPYSSAASSDSASVAAYMELWDCVNRGLTDDAVFAEFLEKCDLDSFLRMTALSIYTGDYDSFMWNIKAYRYLPQEGESVPDGVNQKWRFLLFDSDAAYWRWSECRALSWVLGKELSFQELDVENRMLTSLLQRSEIREDFINILCDYGLYSFHSAAVEPALDGLLADIMHEVVYTFALYEPDKIFDDVVADCENIRHYTKYHFEFLENEMEQYLGYERDKYTVRVAGATGAQTVLSSLVLNGAGTLEGRYSVGNSVRLHANVREGFIFDCWLVDGSRVEDISLRLPAGQAGQTIDVKLCLRTEPFTDLLITEVYHSGSEDWITLYNPTDRRISLKGYQLSDDAEYLDRYVFDGVWLRPGVPLSIPCKNNRSSATLGHLALNFNLSSGETLYLCNPTGQIIGQLHLRMLPEEQRYVYDHDSRQWIMASAMPRSHS